MSEKVTAPEEVKLSPEPQKEQKQKPSIAEMDAELKALELEAARLRVQEQKANLEDVRERLAERELKRDNVRQEAFTKGATLKQIAQNETAVQKRCNHKKGGNGAGGIILGQGDSPDYAVIKHTFAHGDMWIRCTRCGKTWKPPLEPVETNFVTKDDYYKAREQYSLDKVAYETAVSFQTKNTPSSSAQFRFSDGGAYYREVTKDATLR